MPFLHVPSAKPGRILGHYRYNNKTINFVVCAISNVINKVAKQTVVYRLMKTDGYNILYYLTLTICQLIIKSIIHLSNLSVCNELTSYCKLCWLIVF